MSDLPAGWVEMALPEVIDFQEGPGIMARDFRDAGVPLVRLAGLSNGSSVLQGCNYLDPEMVARRWSHFGVQEGDTLLSTSASLGRVARVGSEAVGAVPYTGIIRMRPRDTRLDAHFVKYLLSSSFFQRQAEAMGAGSVMRHFGPSHLREMTVILPPVDEQRAIAAVLDSLDDKIELNHRLVSCLHSIAKAELVQWRGGVGRWNRTTFGEFANVNGGSTPRTTEPSYWGGPHAWATPTDVTSLAHPYLFGTARTITDAGLASCSTELHPAGSIFMTSRATIGAFAVNQLPCAANQGFIVVRPADAAHRWFLFHEMTDRLPDMLDLANGSTFMEISRGSFKGMAVDVPVDSAAFVQLAERLEPLHDRARTAASESIDLATLRDALLPALLSGRLRVKDAERMVED